ncbi:MAG: MarR family winged helix-turn-helix transcriptional regulator [Suilimivivens sp.]
MDLGKTLNTLFVTLFQDILNIEEKALITGEFQDITINDMHVIEAIGIGEPKTSSTVAKELSITVGTLTKAIDRLTKCDYVLRERSDKDKRLVLLSLKEKGVKAYYHHEKFHEDMIQAVISQFDREEAEFLAKSLNGLIDYLKDNGEVIKKESISAETIK